MKKKALVFRVACMIAIMTSAVFAQKLQAIKTDAIAIPAKKSILQKYIDVSSLPAGKNSKAFAGLSANDKTAMLRLHLALQLAGRQNLTAGQKDLILEAINLATTDIYDSSAQKRAVGQQAMSVLALKAKSLFSEKEALEIFGNIKANIESIEKLQRYADLAPYDLEARKQTFKGYGINERVQAWDIHAAVFLAENTDMHAYQQSFILSLFDFIDPQIFEITSGNPQWENKVNKPAEALMRQAKQLFSKDEIISLFAELGGPRGTTPLAAKTAGRRNRLKMTANATAAQVICAPTIAMERTAPRRPGDAEFFGPGRAMECNATKFR